MDARQRENLRKLEINEGGVAFANRKTEVSTDPAVVIGLGGYGGYTLNTLRRKVNRSLNDRNKHKFLAIDTCADDMEDIMASKGKYGHLRDNECIGMYDSATAHVLLAQRPGYMREWLKDDSLVGVELDNTGAQQVRQVARVMLSSGSSYMNIKSNIRNKINEAIGGAAPGAMINIIITTGIAGGTGSGTIVDIAYMVRDIMREIHFTSYNLTAYLYLPDAMYSVEGIASNPTLKENLQRNGYAAMKEIDYFMNLRNYQGEYRFSYLGGTVTSTEDIFDSCNLISGYGSSGGLRDRDELVDGVTDNILELLSNVTDVAGVQSSRAFLSNQRTAVLGWLSGKAGQSDYPQLANYGYNIIGYSSINIPKDEIMTYCANMVFQEVHREFERLSDVNEAGVTTAMEQAQVATIDGLIDFILDKLNLPVKAGDVLGGNLPTKQMISNGSDYTRESFMDYVDAALDVPQIRNGEFADQAAQTLIDLFKEELDNRFNAKGPFYMINLLTAKVVDGYSCDGIIERLRSYGTADKQVQLQNYYSNALKERSNQIQASRQAVSRTMFGAQNRISEYLSDCERYGNTYLEQCLIVGYQGSQSVFMQVLNKLLAALTEENNKVYNVYTNVLEELNNILKRDANYAADPTRAHHAGGETFSFNVVNLYDADTKTAQLKAYLEGFISPQSVDRFTADFIRSMRNNRDAWVAEGQNFDAAGEIRRLFDNFFSGTLQTEMIEKFLVVAYADTQLSIDDLDQIWENNPDQKDAVLHKAAASIIDNLVKNGSVMASTNGAAAYDLSLFTQVNQIGLLDGISATFRDHLTNQIGIKVPHVTVSNSGGSDSRITYSKLHIGVPIYALHGAKELDENYESRINDDGLHMDEVKDNWFEFPQPYMAEAAARITPGYTNARDAAIAQRVVNEVSECIKTGAIVQDPAQNCHVLYAFGTEPADWEKLANDLYQEKLESADLTMSEFLTQKERAGEVSLKRVPLKIINKNNINYNSLDETKKVVRMDVHLMREVEKAVNQYKGLYEAFERGQKDGAALMTAANRYQMFVNCIKTKVVFKVDNPMWKAPVWYYEASRNEKLADLTKKTNKQVYYHLYCAFNQFCKLPENVIGFLEKKIEQNDADEIYADMTDLKAIGDGARAILEEMRRELDIPKFNKTVSSQFIKDFVFDIAVEQKDLGDPFEILQHFYERIAEDFDF